MQAVRLKLGDHRAVARFYEANEARLGPLLFSFHQDFWKWLLSSEMMRVGAICYGKKIVAIGIGLKGWDHLVRYLPHRSFGEQEIVFHQTVKKMLWQLLEIECQEPATPIRLMRCLLPINNRKLIKLGLLDAGEPYVIPPLENKLQLMQRTDIPGVSKLLSDHSGQYDNPPVFSPQMVEDAFLPRKHLVYSFVVRNPLEEVTDFITVYQGYNTNEDSGSCLKVAYLGFHQVTTMSSNVLIRALVDKLFNYGFDQMFILDFASNRVFDIDFFTSSLMISYDLPTDKCISWPF